ncbi:hypothetical protein [Nitrospira sp. BLG_1]|uniref:hypothetical protein n=1 Tax=Nitrospira sp. BLG_1 TaxID=3395883 RepID=UPI0039BD1E58
MDEATPGSPTITSSSTSVSYSQTIISYPASATQPGRTITLTSIIETSVRFDLALNQHVTTITGGLYRTNEVGRDPHGPPSADPSSSSA